MDDSIATSPDRTTVAFHSFDAPIVWIAGGRSKHLPWDALLEAGRDKVRAVVLIGEAAQEIERAVKGPLGWPGTVVVWCHSLAEAVPSAASLAEPGDRVLLSPGCTSYDQFVDFEERGRAFRAAVMNVRRHEC